MTNLGCECNGTNKKRIGPDQDGRFYRVDCNCKTATQTMTEPTSCREYIERANCYDLIVNRAFCVGRVEGWEREQTLEYLVVSLLENRKEMQKQLHELYRDDYNRIVSGE